ncbi:hypothetical protein V6N12_032283 [Hibiscus sabdariffa]|uniref:DUF4283 domain-containing protein n=1 Tax=Hibiscus sabdariffa TaxID=183260 RepID=A0ABR2CC54_9ROSI
MPVWVQLFNIPLELFSQQDLSYIASAIVKVWKRKHVVPVEGVGLIHEIGESSHSVEVLVQNRVEADVEVVMQSLDQLAESVVGKVDGEKEALGAIGSGGVVEVREDGAQLAFVEPNDQEFPSLHES